VDGEPMTVAIGEEFHLGRASRGMRPPVPVLIPDNCRSPSGVLDLGAKTGMLRRDDLDDGGWVETDRLRGVVSILSLRRDGKELTLALDLMEDESLEDVRAVGDTAP